MGIPRFIGSNELDSINSEKLLDLANLLCHVAAAVFRSRMGKETKENFVKIPYRLFFISSMPSMLQSAGILLFKYVDGELKVMLVHPGGPFWAAKDEGAWSIPKGLIEENEEPLAAARREFKEETGFDAAGEFIELGWLKQPNRKIIHVWAVECDLDVAGIISSLFVLEWPKKSGKFCEFPEIDRGEWFNLAEARIRIHKGQLGFLDMLTARLRKKTD